MYELKAHLRGLIVLLSVIVVACSTTTAPDITSRISAKYYMVKPASEKDEQILKEYTKSADMKLANEAKCLLAGYYVKVKKYDKSDEMFKESTSELFDSQEFGPQLAYWRIISQLENNKKPIEKDVLTLLGNIDKRSINLKRNICNRYNHDELGDLCIIKSNKNVVEKTDGKSNELEEIVQHLADDVTISIDAESMSDDLVKGVLYAIKENDLKYKIELGVNSESIVQISSRLNESKISNDTYRYSALFSNDISDIADYIWVKNSDFVVIGVDKQHVEDGILLKAALEEVGVTVIILGYEETDFRTKLNVINEEYGENEILYFGFGTEKAMTEFVPLVRFMSNEPETVEISIAVDLFSNLYFDEDVWSYFKGVEVLSYLNSNSNYWSKKFENGYNHFYGEKPTAKSFYGYDMILQIRSFSDKAAKTEYVSNIDKFDGNNAKRKLKYYKIKSKVQVEELN